MARNGKWSISRHPALMLPIIIVVIGTVTASASIVMLFNSTINEDKSKLGDIVHTQARLMESIAEFDSINSEDDHIDGAFSATMVQIMNAHKKQDGFGRTGEFVIGMLVDDKIAILQKPRFQGDVNFQIPEFPPTPMHRALVHGETGEIIAQDYWGKEVLAAYQPVSILNIGLVAKIDTEEIYRPFIVSSLIVAVLTVIMLVIGIYASRTFSIPFKLLEASEIRFNRSQEFANIGTWDWNIQTGDLFWSDHIASLFGYKTEKLETTYENFLAAIHPDDRQSVVDAINGCVENGDEYTVDHRVVWPDGTVRWLHESGDVVRDENGNPVNMLGVVRDITENKWINEEVTRLGHQNELILSSAGDGIYGVDLDGLCTFANPAAAKVLGYETDELVGQNQHTLLHHTKLDGTHYPHMESPIYAAFMDGKVHTVNDEVFWRKDGTSFPVEYASTPIFEDGKTTGAVVVFRDITERRQAGQALEEAHQFNETIFAGSPIGIAIYDDTGQCILTNDSFGVIINATREQVLAQNYHHIASWKECGLYDQVLECQSSGERTRYEMSVKSSFGRNVFLDCHLVSISVNEKRHLLLMINDTTENKIMQEQLIKSSKMATLGEMATGVAHELNQPMNVIRMAVHNIQRKSDNNQAGPEYLSEKLNKISRQVERATAIIDHMRIFGRKPDAIPLPLDAKMMIDSVLGLIGEQLRLAEIEVTTQAPEQSRPVLGHQVQVEQVLLNLIGNARDVLKDKENGDKRISITVAEENDKVVISVEDTGGGIGPGALDHIFEPFFTTKEIGSGTGLGLSISYGIITDMGGTIEAQNTGEGARFTVTLPAYEEYTAVD